MTRGGAVETTGDYDTSALADVDGDGRADLCTLVAGSVSCALSHGRAFGPRVPLLAATGVALWLGDLDGDGVAEPCVDTGDAIVCAAPQRASER